MSEERWPLPDPWCWTAIEDIAEVVGGGTPKASDPDNFSARGIPWLTPADLTGYSDAYIARGARDLSEQGLKSSSAKLMPAGSVLFSSRAPIGYCAIASNEISTNQGFKSLVLGSGVDPEFTRLYLLSAKDYAESKASGTTFKEISGARVKKLAVPLPPLAEQKRIVAKLDRLSARSGKAKEHLAAVQTLATRAKQATLAAAFRGELGAGPRSKEGWEEVAFSELISDGPTNGWSPKADGDINGTRTLKLSATTSGELDLSEDCVKYLSVRPDEHSKFWLRPGDLLIQRANSLPYLGASAIFEGPVATYIYPDLMMRVRVEDEVMRHYLWRFLNSCDARSYFRDNATGTAGNMPKISGKLLKSLIVPLPKNRRVTEIVRRIETAFAKIDSIAEEASRAADLLDRLDQQLLAKAFRGELVPQDPSDEPASALLARIREARANAPKPKRRRKSAKA